MVFMPKSELLWNVYLGFSVMNVVIMVIGLLFAMVIMRRRITFNNIWLLIFMAFVGPQVQIGYFTRMDNAPSWVAVVVPIAIIFLFALARHQWWVNTYKELSAFWRQRRGLR